MQPDSTPGCVVAPESGERSITKFGFKAMEAFLGIKEDTLAASIKEIVI